MEFIETAIFNLLGGRHIETQLLKCQSYESHALVRWRRHLNLSWRDSMRLFRAIEIFDAQKIRNLITSIVANNAELFGRSNLFITTFGQEEKSGSQILYEFKHTGATARRQFIEAYKLSNLPEGSTIIFVDDLIGSGNQAKSYILNKLNMIINPSCNPILLTICGTVEGIDTVRNETNFEVVTGLLLKEESFQYYSEKNSYFKRRLKDKIIHLNQNLKLPDQDDYDRGLLIAFYYAPPNNSMPILWKNNFPFKKNGITLKWFAPIPRAY